MRNNLAFRLFDMAKSDKKIFLITGDAGYGVWDDFQKQFSDRFLNLGVAEQNAMSFAAGLSMTGFKVVVYNITPFVLYRCYEQVRNDICYQNLPVTIIGIGSGVSYAPLGMTHYSVEDIGIARTLPNLEILSPIDPVESIASIEYAIESKSPTYIRIGRGGEPNIHLDQITDLSEPIILQDGDKNAVLTHGSVGNEVIEACKGMDIPPLIISLPLIHPMNFSKLADILTNIETIVTVEEHYSTGGLGSIISEWVQQNKMKYNIIKLGINNSFIKVIKDNAGMRDYYGISAAKIRSQLEEIK